MAREALLEMNCERYSERIEDIIFLMNMVNWNYRDSEGNVQYLPLGDNGQYDWQKEKLTEKQVCELLQAKQDRKEQIGINLYFGDTGIGVTVLAEGTKEILIDLCINRKIIGNSSDSLTDIGWYFENMINELVKGGCMIEYIKFEDYCG